MDPITFPMFTGGKIRIYEPGEFVEGGYFAGYISHSRDGKPTHGLIIAPKASGQYDGGLAWGYKVDTPGADSEFDGAVNTAAHIAAGVEHPEYTSRPAAAVFCNNLTINGFSDWYLPSINELEICYYNLKPTRETNYNVGRNYYAVPKRTDTYTDRWPRRTEAPEFQLNEPSGTEAFFDGSYWSSTQDTDYRDVDQGQTVSFSKGLQTDRDKDWRLSVRAMRKFAV